MTDIRDAWEGVIAADHGQVLSDVDRADLEPFVAEARAGGALVVIGSFDPAAAGVGLGPLASVTRDLMAEVPTAEIAAAGYWVQPALDDLTGRSELRRDVTEIYSAVAILLSLAATQRPALAVLEGIEWASEAFLNLLPYLESSVHAPVLILCARSPHVRDLTPEAHLAAAIDLELSDRAHSEPELVGAHLAQALPDDPAQRVEAARRAAAWLARAGAIAVDRSDMVSAARLLSRASALLEPKDPARLRYLADSCEALLATGHADEIVELVRNGIREAEEGAEDCGRARLRVWQLMVDDDSASDEPPTSELESLGAALEGCGDDSGVARVEEALAHIAWITDDEPEAIERMRKGIAAADRAKARTPLSRMAAAYLSIVAAGSTPVGDAIRAFELIGPIALHSSLVEISLKANAASLFALVGHFDVARDELGDAEALQSALGQPPWVARVPRVGATIELLDGNPSKSLERASEGLDALLEMEHPAGIDAGVIAARALCELSRHHEAVEISRRLLDCLGAVTISEAPEITEGEIHGVLARALAATGDPEDAFEAIVRSDESAPPVARLVQRGDRLLDTAQALALLGDRTDAKARAGEAADLYQAKGASVSEARARAFSEEVGKNL